jgi:flagellar basal-body rod protein FlgF
MDKVVYTSMGGAKVALRAQGINSHNLANINTSGFRAHLTSSEPAESGGAARVNVVRARETFSTDHGPLQVTDRDLDVALAGPGWLVVEDALGREAFTRAGSLHINELGELRNAANQYVLGESGRLVIPQNTSLTIAATGEISVVPIGQGPGATTVVGKLKLVNPDPLALQRGVDGLFRTRDGVFAASDPAVRLQSGALEGSNVNGAEVLVNMIELSRSFEMQMRTIRAVEENARSAQSLLSMTG